MIWRYPNFRKHPYTHDGSMWPVHTYIYLHEWVVFMGSMYRVLEVGESWGEWTLLLLLLISQDLKSLVGTGKKSKKKKHCEKQGQTHGVANISSELFTSLPRWESQQLLSQKMHPTKSTLEIETWKKEKLILKTPIICRFRFRSFQRSFFPKWVIL